MKHLLAIAVVLVGSVYAQAQSCGIGGGFAQQQSFQSFQSVQQFAAPQVQFVPVQTQPFLTGGNTIVLENNRRLGFGLGVGAIGGGFGNEFFFGGRGGRRIGGSRR